MTGKTVAPIGVLTAGLLLLAGCGDIDDSDIVSIPQAELRALTLDAPKNPKAVLLIDARSPAAFSLEHIAGATSLQMYDLDPDRPRLRRLDGFDDLVVYGDDPGSTPARGLVKKLMEQKYTPVRWYQGGLMEWKAAGFPTEVSASKAREAK